MFKSSRNLSRISGPPNSFNARPENPAELPAFNYEVSFFCADLSVRRCSFLKMALKTTYSFLKKT